MTHETQLSARPICARCNKPVESFIEEYADGWGVRFVARCHGERETITLTEKEACSGIRFERAFAMPLSLPGSRT